MARGGRPVSVKSVDTYQHILPAGDQSHRELTNLVFCHPRVLDCACPSKHCSTDSHSLDNVRLCILFPQLVVFRAHLIHGAKRIARPPQSAAVVIFFILQMKESGRFIS
jgi:hypothetical protein